MKLSSLRAFMAICILVAAAACTNHESASPASPEPAAGVGTTGDRPDKNQRTMDGTNPSTAATPVPAMSPGATPVATPIPLSTPDATRDSMGK